MAENNAKFTTQEVTRGNIRYRQILNGNQVVGEEELGEVKAMKPNTPPPAAEPATAATDPAPATEPVKPAEPEQKKGLSAKLKRGLAIGGGVVAGIAAYALGVKRGKDEGNASGYAEGYRDGMHSAETTEDVNDNWEAQE